MWSQFMAGAAFGAVAVLLLFLIAGYRAARRKARTENSVSHIKESVVAVLQSEGGRKRVIN